MAARRPGKFNGVSTMRTVLVTGGGRGIGAAIAKMFEDLGDSVAVADLSFETFSRSANRLTGPCDVRSRSSVATFSDRVESEFGPVEILVNNAGIYPMQPFESITESDWQNVMATNVDSVFHFCQATLPGMRRRKFGRIINIVSNTFFMGLPNLAHYVASKGAVIGLTKSLAAEVGADGITVNCIAPNFTRTEGTRIVESEAPEVVKQTVASQAIPRVGLPSDILGSVQFLASDGSAFMTAQTMVVDGGTVRH
jgi:NAD(P)-dependent dehydrogenase (short-subunit alcohol dehydrogenase family)